MLKAIVFAFVAAGLWLMINVKNLHAFLDAYHHRNQEYEQVELLKQRVAKLKREQASLQNNGFEAERQARVVLGMQLPGENVIILKKEATPAPAKSDDSGLGRELAGSRTHLTTGSLSTRFQHVNFTAHHAAAIPNESLDSAAPDQAVAHATTRSPKTAIKSTQSSRENPSPVKKHVDPQ